jgi:hypothetical protein
VQRPDAGLLQLPGKRQIEIRGIHTDEYIRQCFQEIAAQFPAHGQQPGQVPDHFGQAHNRQTFHRIQAETTGIPHTRARNTLKQCLRHLLTNGMNQAGGYIVTGCFTGNDANVEGMGIIRHAPFRGLCHIYWLALHAVRLA